MNTNWILSLLVHKGVITLDEAEHLAAKLAQTILTQDFQSAHATITKILEDLEAKNKKHLSL